MPVESGCVLSLNIGTLNRDMLLSGPIYLTINEISTGNGPRVRGSGRPTSTSA